MRLAVRVLLGIGGGWLAVWEVHAIAVPGLPVGPVRWLHLVVMAVGSALCLARAWRVREERVAWTLIGLALASWIGGETYFTLVLWDDASPPVPSPADVGYLGLPPLLFAGLVLLLRARVRGLPRTLWVDGLTSALAVGALSAAVVLQAVLDTVGGTRLAVATNLAYPLADLVLLGVIVGGAAATGWRSDRTFGLLALGTVSFAASDSIYLVLVAQGTWVPGGGPFDTGWWATALLLGAAAWQPPGRRVAVRSGGTAVIAVPIAFSMLGLGVLVAGSAGHLNVLAIVLATASLGAVMARLVITFREHAALLRSSRHEARTDALTGLGNRRALTLELERLLDGAGEPAPSMLALFDLDGFKRYNDTFGHPAGDALLQRLGAALCARLRDRGSAYRMGGDEFCALISGADRSLLLECTAALAERGDGFGIDCSHGAVVLPREAGEPDAALRLADQRLYACKHGRASAGDGTKGALLQTLAERDPRLADHLHDVAELAEAVGRALGLTPETVDQLRQAAELHDVGKVAIPDAILAKRGPLDADEWAFVRRHTVIGERIINAAPALAGVAGLVRSSHERWDGTGYPDRLSGEAIPVGARVVAVCDAYDAMTTDRSYRRAMEPAQALAELRRCAGTQFDPRVAEALGAVLAARSPVARVA